jgi:hypothetical protein
MDSEDDFSLLNAAAAAAVIIIKRRRRRRQQQRRSLWMKPWLTERASVRGMSYFINHELANEVMDFHGFLRMTPSVFQELLECVAPRIAKADTFMRDSITAEEMLTCTLRYLASGKPHRVVSLR